MPMKDFLLDRLSSLEMEVRYRASGRDVDDLLDPIFIVGCGHSGTSLLLKILGAHSRIHAVHFESSLGFHMDMAERTVSIFSKMTINAGKQRWVEKTPKHVRKLAELTEYFPNGRFLFIVRDGRDVACSIRRRGLTVRDGIDRWVNDNEAALPFLDRKNVMQVSYEEIVADFEPAMTKILSFCGEDYEEQLVDFYRYPLDFQEPFLKSKWVASLFRGRQSKRFEHRDRRREQVHQKLFDARGEWEGSLSEEEKGIIKARASGLLRRFGYAENDD
jgi:hypothetical protein